MDKHLCSTAGFDPSLGGLANMDRSSQRAAWRRWYQKNKEKRRAEVKAWRLAHPGYNYDWYKLNPEKLRAKWTVRYAVKTGKLKPQPCVRCGKKKTETHHDDYTKPLDVVWMCRVCHRKEHRVDP